MYCKVPNNAYLCTQKIKDHAPAFGLTRTFSLVRGALHLQSETKNYNSMVNVDNTKSQMRKGMLEYCILLLLRHRPLYANDIISQLKEAEMIVVEGTLYPLLNRLKKDGLLKYEWQESTQGPPRKYYALTEDGEDALQQLDASWNELAKTVNILHENNPY